MDELDYKLGRVKEIPILDLQNLCEDIRQFLIVSNSTGGILVQI